jgi:hypothetical protein
MSLFTALFQGRHERSLGRWVSSQVDQQGSPALVMIDSHLPRRLLGCLLALALGLLVAPLGAAASPPGQISRMGDLTPKAGVAADKRAGPSTVLRDWRGLGRDTAFFVGYEALAAGVAYLLPERVTHWTPEQRRISLQHWWANVRDPKWDPDRWYFNYLGHPYFGAIVYVRARERGFGAWSGLGYAAVLSGLYEYGIEALFERPSYQDLLVTPVGGCSSALCSSSPSGSTSGGKRRRTGMTRSPSP